MKTFFFSFLVVMALAGHAHARLIGGTIAKEGEGPGVFQIAAQNPMDKEDSGLCTAAKISKKIFITAAHCFSQSAEYEYLGLSTQIENKNFEFERIEIEQIIIHPSWSEEENGNSSLDLALVVVKPNKLFDSIKEREMDFNVIGSGEEVEVWGYGCQKSVNDHSGYTPVKKWGLTTTQKMEILEEVFEDITPDERPMLKEFYQNTFLSAGLNKSSAALSVCWGDSGGPVFKSGKIVGVNYSYLAKGMSEEGKSPTGLSDINLHQRLSIVEDWIKSTLARYP